MTHNPNRVIEITSFRQLMEMSSVGGGNVQGPAGVPFGKKEDIEKFNEEEKEAQRLKSKKLTEEEEEMIKREDVIVEQMLRKYIRDKIKTIKHQQFKTQTLHETQLRQVIRTLLTEGDISDIHPHRSTGINILEDLLKKMIPTLRTDFKRLTTDPQQRKSFRAHLVKAIKDALLPSMVNDKYLQGGGEGGGTLLSEPTDMGAEPPEEEEAEEGGDEDEAALASLEEEFQVLDELDIEVGEEDEEKKIPIEKDDTPSEEEAFGTGLEGLDETGRNMAFACFKKVSQYILDAYDSLANPKDKEIFIDYLVTNVKLYFDKFEDELQKSVEEPTTDEYESAKAV